MVCLEEERIARQTSHILYKPIVADFCFNYIAVHAAVMYTNLRSVVIILLFATEAGHKNEHRGLCLMHKSCVKTKIILI